MGELLKQPRVDGNGRSFACSAVAGSLVAPTDPSPAVLGRGAAELFGAAAAFGGIPVRRAKRVGCQVSALDMRVAAAEKVQ